MVTRHNKGFDNSTTIPVGTVGQSLFLMVSGMTYPVQSHVVNLRVALDYADGTTDGHGLVSPFDIGDCWSTWCGLYFDTPANGFENIGGRSVPAGTAEVSPDAYPIAIDTVAHLPRFELLPMKTLNSVRVETVANDVMFGIMGVPVRNRD